MILQFAILISYCGAPVPSTYIISNECVYDSIYFSHQLLTPTDIIRFKKKSYTDNVAGLIKCFNVSIFQLLLLRRAPNEYLFYY